LVIAAYEHEDEAAPRAVANAIGHRMKDLPITRDKIVAALAGRGGRA